MTASEFLTLLWGEVPPGFISLWRLADKSSFYVRAPDAATVYADGQADVYTSVALTNQAHGRHKRATAAQAGALAGLWLDVDVNGGPDGKQGAAPTIDAALSCVIEVAEPTVIINSGYGLHAWWLFEEPWVFRSQADRELAARMSAQWQKLHRCNAEECGWGVDATHDLARLMRLPGTYNSKGDVQVPVTVVAAKNTRYDRLELADLCARAGDVETRETRNDAGAKLDESLDQAAFAELYRDNSTFAATWNHERDDRPNWSMSEHDLALCAHAAQAGWSDDQLAALIAEHRRQKDPSDQKADRSDYIQRTISKATAARAAAQAQPSGSNADRAKDRQGRRLVITPASAFGHEAVKWLEYPWIAIGGPTIAAGEPGLGKSTWGGAHLAAKVSTGQADGALTGVPHDVLIATAEDAWNRQVAPRLALAGADMARVSRVEVETPDGTGLLTLPNDVELLEAECKQRAADGRPIALLVIDPISAFLSEKTDSHKESSVRRALAPLAGLAERLDIAILVIAHLNKDESRKVLSRVSGSTAFGAAARSVIAFARDPDDPDGEAGYQRVIVHLKNNWGKLATSRRARIESVDVALDNGDIAEVSRIVDLGECDTTASDLQGGRNAADSDSLTTEQAVISSLQGGPRPSLAVKEEVATRLGVSTRTVERAATALTKQNELIIVTTESYPRTTTWELVVTTEPLKRDVVTDDVATEQTRMDTGNTANPCPSPDTSGRDQENVVTAEPAIWLEPDDWLDLAADEFGVPRAPKAQEAQVDLGEAERIAADDTDVARSGSAQ